MLNEEAVREALSKTMACNCHPILALGEVVKDKYQDHVDRFVSAYSSEVSRIEADRNSGVEITTNGNAH